MKGSVGTATQFLRFKRKRKQRPLTKKERKIRRKYAGCWFNH